MSWEDLCIWIEQYAGCNYDLTDSIRELKGDAIFLNTTTWRNQLSILMDQLSAMVDIIEEQYDSFPEDFPSKENLKKYITMEVLGSIVDIVDDVKQKLGIEPSDIRRFKVLEHHVDALCDLIHALSENSIETLIKKEWFDEYENDNKDFFKTVFQISKQDLPSMQFTVNDIKEMHDDDEE